MGCTCPRRTALTGVCERVKNMVEVQQGESARRNGRYRGCTCENIRSEYERLRCVEEEDIDGSGGAVVRGTPVPQ